MLHRLATTNITAKLPGKWLKVMSSTISRTRVAIMISAYIHFTKDTSAALPTYWDICTANDRFRRSTEIMVYWRRINNFHGIQQSDSIGLLARQSIVDTSAILPTNWHTGFCRMAGKMPNRRFINNFHGATNVTISTRRHGMTDICEALSRY